MLERLKTENESENTSEGVILCEIHRRQKRRWKRECQEINRDIKDNKVTGPVWLEPKSEKKNEYRKEEVTKTREEL